MIYYTQNVSNSYILTIKWTIFISSLPDLLFVHPPKSYISKYLCPAEIAFDHFWHSVLGAFSVFLPTGYQISCFLVESKQIRMIQEVIHLRLKYLILTIEQGAKNCHFLDVLHKSKILHCPPKCSFYPHHSHHSFINQLNL